VYQVTLATGAAQDYCVLLDTNNTTGLTVPVTAATTKWPAQLGPRLFFGSTTATTVINFDPPILFYNGLMAECSDANVGAAITFEIGRGLSGN
jgi:hypothetical protein